MKRKHLRLVIINMIVLAAVILSFYSLYSQPPAQYLFKIDKTPNLTAVLLQYREITIIQELETCFLGIADEKNLSRLGGMGFSPRILDRVPGPQERYFLVNLRDLNRLYLLERYGKAWLVEGNNVLFRPIDVRHPREILPGIFRSIKKLGTPVNILPKPLKTHDRYPLAESRQIDPLVAQMVSGVSKNNLENDIQTLQNFNTRDAVTDGCKQAGNFIYNKLLPLGIQVEYDNFNFEGYSSRNIVGYWPGTIDPSSLVILCAHYDSYAEPNSLQYAPGADDNASGTAAVLEAARIMSGYSFRYSIKFILFSAEEWGFYGSDHYAREAEQRGEKIIGVINLDMISYTDYLPEDLEVITNSGSNWMGEVIETAAQNYSTIEVSTTQDGSYYYSDQASFWDRGYPAVLCIEDYEDTNPYYHSRYDTLDKINLDFLTEAGKVCLAAAAQLAQPQTSQVTGITVDSPNGGESWKVGTSHPITWTTSGTVDNVRISYTTDNGTNWTAVTSSTANDGAYTWTVPNILSTRCKIKISEASDGNPTDTSDGIFSIVSGALLYIDINPGDLDFCTLTPGIHTGTQEVWLTGSGEGTLNWQTGTNAAWLSAAPAAGTDDGIITVSVDSAGLGVGTYTGTISITSADAANSPQYLSVTLKVKPDYRDMPPFGEFSTPLDGSVVNSSIPVTGWVLDDIGLGSVKIYREAGNSLVYIGDGVFVEGARPDVETAYPGYPCNYKAGWGYMMLTNFLPNQGNGKFTFYAIARDLTGHEAILGTKTVTCNNSAAVKPFGAIDTPTQGGRISGSTYVDFGWVLTPLPHRIPFNGSTLRVYVDGVNLGSPVYNIYRQDIADLFPGYKNSNGAVGYLYLDTTLYSNGLHTIQWTAVDDGGNTDGIGSRYFTILNTGNNSRIRERRPAGLPPGMFSPDFLQENIGENDPVEVLKGFSKNRRYQKIYPGDKGIIAVVIDELELLEVHLPGRTGGLAPRTERSDFLTCTWRGFQVIGDRLRSLPVGSRLDSEKGIFYWQPGPGFLGNYRLVFIGKDQQENVTAKNGIIKIQPMARF
jgi:hypothetical protein